MPLLVYKGALRIEGRMHEMLLYDTLTVHRVNNICKNVINVERR